MVKTGGTGAAALCAGMMAAAGIGTAAAQTVSVANASIAELLAAQASGALTCAAIASQVDARIKRHDGDLKVFLTVNPDMATDAARLDAERQNGRMRPLHCIPIAIKDNINTAGIRTTGGSVLFANVVPAKDSAVVARLRAAGALIVGKTNLDELAVAGSTISSLGGQTLNPYDRSRFAAGSSGGSAVAVATGMVTAALGTETVNSLRNAANSAGVVGIRPTRGLVSRTGVMPLSTTMDVVGPIARSVADAAAILDVLIGRDPADPSTVSVEAFGGAKLAEAARVGSVAGKRIGVLRTLFGGGAEHGELNAVLGRALEALKRAGADIVEIDDPEFDTERGFQKLNVNNFEFKALFERYLAELGPNAPVATVKEYVAAGGHPKTMRDYLANAVAWDAPTEKPEYLELLRNGIDFRQKLAKLMDEKHFDALAYPMQKRPSLKITEATRPERNGVFASALGLPAIDVPAGFTAATADAPAGIPIGIDLMGRRFQDAELIALAAGVERVLAARHPPLE